MVKKGQIFNMVFLDNYKLYFVLFVIGIIVYFLREHSAFVTPYLYTEDGVWLSMILNDGFLYALLNAKAGYLVVGNILLLKLVLVINSILFGDNLVYLPQIVSFVGYSYYSFIALSVVLFLKEYISLNGRLLLFFMLLLMPMGWSSYEIIDKISNVGYLFFFLTFLILVWRLKVDRNSKWIIPADILLIVSCATNPACYALILLYIIYSLFTFFVNFKREEKSFSVIFRENKKTIKFLSLVITLFILFGIIVFLQIYKANIINDTKHTILYSNLIQFFSRCFLYPIIAPLYSSLNNIIALCFLVFLIVVGALSIYIFRNSSISKIFNFTFLALILFSTITLIGRPSLTHNLINYSSFPDRYFLVCNYFVFVLIGIAFNSICKNIRNHNIFFSITFVLLFSLTLWSSLRTLPVGGVTASKTWLIGISKSFKENIKDYINVGSYIIDIEFDGWKANLPPKYVYATLTGKRSSSYEEALEEVSVKE